MPEGAVYVGRPTRWGNPWAVGDECEIHFADGYTIPWCITIEIAVTAYRDVMDLRLSFPDRPAHPEDDAITQAWIDGVAELRGHDLVCWCPLDQPCHADVLLELANA